MTQSAAAAAADTAGRIDASGWDDHDKTDPGFTLSLAAFDAPGAGRMAFAIVADSGQHPDTAPYRLSHEAGLPTGRARYGDDAAGCGRGDGEGGC